MCAILVARTAATSAGDDVSGADVVGGDDDNESVISIRSDDCEDYVGEDIITVSSEETDEDDLLFVGTDDAGAEADHWQAFTRQAEHGRPWAPD